MKNIINVVLVDDHDLFRAGFSMFLQHSIKEFKVVLTVKNGFELKDRLLSLEEEHFPKMIITDSSMPILNGFETAKWIKAHYPEIKVVILTMHEEETTILRMIRLGVDGYLLKTADTSELFASLKAIAFGQKQQADNLIHKYTSSVREILAEEDSQISRETILQNWQELPSKEKDFVRLCCQDITFKEVADRSGRSIGTMNLFRDKVFKKLGVTSRISLLFQVMKHNLFDLKL